MTILAAVRFGQISATPSLAKPVVLDDGPCPVCAKTPMLRKKCPNCHGWGKACVLIEPVANFITPAAYDVPMAADLAAKGSWPNGRGWLHETASCVAAVRYWWDLEGFWKAKLGLKD